MSHTSFIVDRLVEIVCFRVMFNLKFINGFILGLYDIGIEKYEHQTAQYSPTSIRR